MRWIVTLVALAAGAWFFSNRRRRDRVGDTMRQAVPPDAAQKAMDQARQAVDAAASTVQQASASVTNRVQQAAEAAQQKAQETVAGAAGTSVHTDVDAPPPSVSDMTAAERADVEEQVDTIRGQAEAPPVAAEDSAMATTGTSVADTVTGELADATGAPEQPAPQATAGAGATGQQAGEVGAQWVAADQGGDVARGSAGEMAVSDGDQMTPAHGNQAPTGGATGQDEDIAPEGQRPRPIAGEGTTTAAGGAVNPLSPVGDGPTASGVAEPLPEGLTEGEPGTGGPRASAQAPSTPDSDLAPTIGMEQPPEIDRAAEIAQRTSGKFIGHKGTRVFHSVESNHLPGESNRIYFESEEEALAAGFRPAEGEGLSSAGE